jgi:hypothetical protein
MRKISFRDNIWKSTRAREGKVVHMSVEHPKLVETGLDLLAFPTLYFYETGYSLHTLRQALAPLVAYRPEASCPCEVPGHQGDDANHVPAADGEEDVGGIDDGRQVLR